MILTVEGGKTEPLRKDTRARQMIVTGGHAQSTGIISFVILVIF
jgi:hypothetical protein